MRPSSDLGIFTHSLFLLLLVIAVLSLSIQPTSFDCLNRFTKLLIAFSVNVASNWWWFDTEWYISSFTIGAVKMPKVFMLCVSLLWFFSEPHWELSVELWRGLTGRLALGCASFYYIEYVENQVLAQLTCFFPATLRGIYALCCREKKVQVSSKDWD